MGIGCNEVDWIEQAQNGDRLRTFTGHDATTVVVKVSEGALRGRSATTKTFKAYYSFQGVPYARPPVGELRFRSPRAMAPWIGVRDALEEGSVCPQAVPDLNGTEDCLFLNIYTPQVGHPDVGRQAELDSELIKENVSYVDVFLSGRQLPRNESSLLPVMAFLPGGGLYHGSATSQMYGPDYLVDAGVVLVTINYRLGPLGFLGIPHPEVTVNAGMKDQVAALRWIQWNIRQFGGDPKKVTLFGESAGGLSVEFHLLSHMSIGLFKQAISESGSVLDPFSYAKSTYEKAFKLAQILGFNTSDVNELVKFLKQVPADQLVLHQMETLSKELRLKQTALSQREAKSRRVKQTCKAKSKKKAGIHLCIRSYARALGLFCSCAVLFGW
uniref:Carboxylic ester hydrolase n=1 Tax=Timema genevievae TaxID=629358 RepID=A0A7R9JVZ3_TIMGE|nr:unnamed protein product [Timema genevievae]